MICAAVSGGSAVSIINATMSISQTNSGIRINVIPRQRMLNVVAMTLTAEAKLPIPLTKMPNIQ